MNIKENSTRKLITALLIIHGLGHLGGYWMLTKSWLNLDIVENSIHWLFVGLWAASGFGFLSTAMGYYRHKAWWRGLALISSLFSLPPALLFFTPNLNLAGALLVDLAVSGWIFSTRKFGVKLSEKGI